MPPETIPQKITPMIKKLCNTLAPLSEIVIVPVFTASPAPRNECFSNVKTIVDKSGGESISGWVIWQWANILIEAEAHAVWKTPKGNLLDITPHEGEKEIMFLPDKNVIYKGTPIPSHRVALTNSKLVDRFIQLYAKWDIMIDMETVEDVILKDIVQEIIEIQNKLHRPALRNSPCPCESGMKYKQCCGKYE